MRYKVVNEYTPDDLADKVNELLSAGWELQGGVSVCTSDTQCYTEYCQAMVLVSTNIGQWFGSTKILENDDCKDWDKRNYQLKRRKINE